MSLRLKLLNSFLRIFVKPLLSQASSPKLARLSFNLVARFVFFTPPLSLQQKEIVTTSPRRLTARWISCGQVQPCAVILYIHGGGYVVGHATTHSGMLANLSRKCGIRVFAPNYRLAPEAAFPAQIEDVRVAWTALVDRGYRPEHIVIGGDSAGGGLALALLSELCQENTPPAACFVLSPWTDLTLSGASLAENAESDLILPPARISELREIYLQGADPMDPRASPLFAKFPNCPPVFLQGADTEILRDDLSRMATTLAAQGAHVQSDVWGNLPHVWPIFQGHLPEAETALTRIAAFIRQQVPSDRPTDN